MVSVIIALIIVVVVAAVVMDIRIITLYLCAQSVHFSLTKNNNGMIVHEFINHEYLSLEIKLLSHETAKGTQI